MTEQTALEGDTVPAQSKPHPLVVATILIAHTAVAALTWRDIASRTAVEVRGPKNLWRVATALNSASSAAYWIIGRKPRRKPLRKKR